MGPGTLLSLVPLNLEAEDLSVSNIWFLPIQKQYIVGAIYGDRGDLILCNGCPRAFHAACLGLHTVPTSGWQFLNCKDNIDDEIGVIPIMIRLTRVDKEPEYDMGGCVICRENDFSVDKFDDRIAIICDQCEKEYRVGCLWDIGLCELESFLKKSGFVLTTAVEYMWLYRLQFLLEQILYPLPCLN
ncbi:hypothetical protein RYX36_031357 [Vicia faba]